MALDLGWWPWWLPGWSVVDGNWKSFLAFSLNDATTELLHYPNYAQNGPHGIVWTSDCPPCLPPCLWVCNRLFPLPLPMEEETRSLLSYGSIVKNIPASRSSVLHPFKYKILYLKIKEGIRWRISDSLEWIYWTPLSDLF